MKNAELNTRNNLKPTERINAPKRCPVQAPIKSGIKTPEANDHPW